MENNNSELKKNDGVVNNENETAVSSQKDKEIIRAILVGLMKNR